MTIEENISLAPLTTFKIGGPARYFARAQNVDELKEVLAFAKEKSLKTFFLGGGSNILAPDEGVEDLVIRIELAGVEEQGTTLVAAAGESWDALVARAVEKNVWGIENLSGIPGTVGGAVVQNIGAYGQALSQTLEWVEAFDTQAVKEVRLTKEQYQPGYRDSVFKHAPGRYVVLRAALTLATEGKPELSYKDLQARFAGQTPTLKEIREAVLDIRRKKFPDLSKEGTAGSFFKNPILDEAAASKLQAVYPEMPVFAMPETSGKKIPLAWLFDHALKLRGTAVGGARLFEHQLLVIAAERGASSQDVKNLVNLVQNKIRDTLHIEIEPEVLMI